VDISSLTLSGTVDIEIGGVRPYSLTIQAYDNSTFTGSPLGYAYKNGYDSNMDNNWTMTLAPVSGPTTFYFRVYLRETSGSNTYRSIDLNPQVSISVNSGENLKSGITLVAHEAVINLSGTITVTVNGLRPAVLQVVPSSSGGYYLWDYQTDVDSTGNWTIRMPPRDSPENIGFALRFFESTGPGGYLWDAYSTGITRSVYNTDVSSPIPLGSYPFITLEGTIGAITAGGQPVTNYQLYAYTSSTFSSMIEGFASPDAGVWKLAVPVYASDTTLYIRLYYQDPGSGSSWTWANTGISVPGVRAAQITGISIPAITIP
jgi:hypothetical protein